MTRYLAAVSVVRAKDFGLPAGSTLSMSMDHVPFSGCQMNVVWKPPASSRLWKTKARLLPFGVAESLRDKMKTAGALVEWHQFVGGHEIPAGVLAELGTFLRAR